MNYLENDVLTAQVNNEELKGETLELEKMFLVVNSLGVELQKDGNMWCYVYGNLPEDNCIASFEETPKKALISFYRAWETNQ